MPLNVSEAPRSSETPEIMYERKRLSFGRLESSSALVWEPELKQGAPSFLLLPDLSEI
jgi:hypothetical protein